MPAFKRDTASRLRDAERCMKAGEPLTVREASFSSLLMGHTPNTVLELFGIAKNLSPHPERLPCPRLSGERKKTPERKKLPLT